MVDKKSWDWETQEKTISNTGTWKDKFEWVEEFEASPDGEKVAAVVKTGEGEFNVSVNGETWEAPFEKIRYLRFVPDGRLACFASTESEWTVAVDGQAWENKFGFIWNMKFSPDGKNIGCGHPAGHAVWCRAQWRAVGDALSQHDELYHQCRRHPHSRGRTNRGVRQAEIPNFNRVAIRQRQMARPGTRISSMSGTWRSARTVPSWPPKHEPVLYDYTIVVDGVPWSGSFPCVWEPIFHPKTGAVIAPVRIAGKWTLAQDGKAMWDRSFAQCWHRGVQLRWF